MSAALELNPVPLRRSGHLVTVAAVMNAALEVKPFPFRRSGHVVVVVIVTVVALTLGAVTVCTVTIVIVVVVAVVIVVLLRSYDVREIVTVPRPPPLFGDDIVYLMVVEYTLLKLEHTNFASNAVVDSSPLDRHILSGEQLDGFLRYHTTCHGADVM